MSSNDTQVLGKKVSYATEYAPSLLHRIERRIGRDAIKHLVLGSGLDIFRCYEFTCLTPQGMPISRALIIEFSAKSTYLVESKSLKLYLMSFTMTRFENDLLIEETISRDLSRLTEQEVKVSVLPADSPKLALSTLKGICLEEQDFCRNLVIKDFSYSRDILKHSSKDKHIRARYYTHLFRSLCPVTSQPDYATVLIDYEGLKIDEAALLGYLISLREHQGFHEQCVELIYSDIENELKPFSLTVSAFFTRRGGIDINPVRSSIPDYSYTLLRMPRQ